VRVPKTQKRYPTMNIACFKDTAIITVVAGVVLVTAAAITTRVGIIPEGAAFKSTQHWVVRDGWTPPRTGNTKD